jgi:2-polyprenyl-3-methyl-5-hydroxy-6-metoxy-1,4-benzoquinol methylase
MGRTGQGRKVLALPLQYRTRSHASHEHYAPVEKEDGTFQAPNLERDREVLTRRTFELLALVDQLHQSRSQKGLSPQPIRILHVGCGTGDLLHQIKLHPLAQALNLELFGLEPVEIWAQMAAKRGLQVESSPVETASWPADFRFDIIVEHHVLEHINEPRRHLKAVRARLATDGLLIVEVPNLARLSGLLDKEFLQLPHVNVFTPRALATICSHAGLMPVSVSGDEDLMMVCRTSTRDEGKVIFPGPEATEIIMAALANDLRLNLKRGFHRAGVTPRTLELAQRVHQECKTAAGRADLALETAIACEREDKLELAEEWLKRSLTDRKDSEVSCILVRVQTILRHRAANRQPLPPSAQRTANFAFREQPIASLRN